jgi:hypothetical protein
MRLVAIGLIAAVASVGSVRRAHACSCGIEPPTVSPADHATDVPLNAIVIAQFGYGMTPTVELRDAVTGNVVPVTIEPRYPGDAFANGTTIFARPTSPLLPDTTYEVIAGNQLSPPAMTTFTTGETTDTVAPDFAGLVEMTPETMTYPIPQEDGSFCISSCIGAPGGHISRMRFTYADPPADVVHLALRLRTEAGDVGEIPMPVSGDKLLGFSACQVESPLLTPGTSYCGRLVAYDVAGNIAGDTVEICEATRTCAPKPRGSDNGDNCRPSDECIEEASSSGCNAAGSGGSPVAWALVALLACRARRSR